LKNSKSFDGYKGKPEKLDSRTYRVLVNDSTKLDFSHRNSYYFDRNGKKIKDVMSGSEEGSGGRVLEYVYDRKGNIIHNTVKEQDGTVSVQNNYMYNDRGQETQREYLLGSSKTITKTAYDFIERTSVQTRYKNDTIFDGKALIAYDRKWRAVEIKSYGRNGALSSRIEEVRDRRGNVILSRWYNSSNKLYEFYKYSFDKRNNRIGIQQYTLKAGDTSLGQTTKFDYIYDRKGNIVKEGLIMDGKLLWVTKTEFKYR
jgi:hypothetical protein